MAKRSFGRVWATLAASALIAGGVMAGPSVAQEEQGNRGDRSSGQSTQRNQERQDNGRSSQRDEDSDRASSQRDRKNRGTPWLGVFLGRPSSDSDKKGVEVEHVFPAGPAARAGLQSGDIITAINGQRINSPDDLIGMVEDQRPGAKMKFSIQREDEQKNVTVVLGNRDEMGWGGRDRGDNQFGSQSGQFGSQHDPFFHVPPHAMQLEHDRRTYEQHQRIENEIARLREEVRELRDMLQQRR